MNNVNNPPSGQTASLITTSVTPPANTPAPYNVTFTGLVQGTSRSNSSEAKAWRNNAIYAELRNVLLRAGVTPDADNWAQLQQAIVAIADERIGTSFTQSLGSNGWQQLPSGLIIQWGAATLSNGTFAVTFPVAFPAACRSVVLNYNGLTVQGGYSAVGTGTPTTSGFTAWSNTGVNLTFNWLAIGN